jgi:hypothetical protein
MALFYTVAITIWRVVADVSNIGEDGDTSVAAHLCGFMGGVTLGMFVLQNRAEQPQEIYLRWLGISIFATAMVMAGFWQLYFTFDMRGYCVCCDNYCDNVTFAGPAPKYLGS